MRAGPLVRDALESALKTRGLDVKLRANVRISLDYCENEETSGDQRQVVTITAEVKRFRPDEKLDLKLAVTNPQTVAVLLGLSVSFPPDADGKARSALAKKAADEPTVHKTDKAILSRPRSPFGMEVRVAPKTPGKVDKNGTRTIADYVAKTPTDTEGYAFVPIQRDEVYGVELSNDADFDTAVQLRIDGLSMYSFSELRDPNTGLPQYTYVIVPKKSRVFIRGWHVTNETSDEFLVTEYAKSAAKELNSTAPTGTITATFHAAWNPNDPPPADEPKNPNENSLSADATGRGARFEQKFQEVSKKIGVARDVISVRYTR